MRLDEPTQAFSLRENLDKIVFYCRNQVQPQRGQRFDWPGTKARRQHQATILVKLTLYPKIILISLNLNWNSNIQEVKHHWAYMRMRPKVILPPRYLGKHPQMRDDIRHQKWAKMGNGWIMLKSFVSTDSHSTARTYLIAICSRIWITSNPEKHVWK